jgi:hypothetical protein
MAFLHLGGTMNARRPEPRPRPTYTYWPAARPPSRATGASPPRPREYPEAPLQDEDHAAPGLDEPGYGHGV